MTRETPDAYGVSTGVGVSSVGVSSVSERVEGVERVERDPPDTTDASTLTL